MARVALWLGFSYALVSIASGAWVHYGQVYGQGTLGFSLFHRRFGKRERLKVWAAGLPDLLVSGLCWPFLIPFVLLPVLARLRRRREWSPTAFMEEVAGLGRQWGGSGPRDLAAAAFSLLLVGILLRFEDLRAPVLTWLCALWLAWLVWLAVSHLPVLSLRTRSRLMDPSRHWTHTAMAALHFTLVFPLVTAIVVLALSGEPLDLKAVKSSLIKVLTLRGLVWEGPQSTIATVAADPMEILYVAAGTLLYGAVLSKLPRLFAPVSEGELLTAAEANLLHGRPQQTLELLRQLGEDSLRSAELKATALLMAGEVDRARELVEVKFPFVREYVREPMAAMGHLLLLASNWRTSPAVQSTVLAGFLAEEPNEEEVTVAYFVVQGSKWTAHEPMFLEYAADKGFLHFPVLFAAGAQKQALLAESWAAGISSCSIDPSVHAFVQVFRWYVAVRQDPSARKAGADAVATSLAEIAAATRSGPGIFLVHVAVGYALQILEPGDSGNRSMLRDCLEELQERVSMRSRGQEVVKTLRELPRQAIVLAP